MAIPTRTPEEAFAEASGIPLDQARAIVRHQTTCAICGYGMLVKPWSDVVPAEARVTVSIEVGIAGATRVQFHAGCLVANPMVVGAKLAVAAGLAEPEV